MHDLEKEIAEWRHTMSKTSDCPSEMLDELEEHLREEIDRLLRSGASADDALQTAASRLGTPSAVGAECDKLRAKRQVWLPVRVAGILIAATAAVSLAFAVLFFERKGILLVTHVFCVTLGYLIMFAMGGLSIVYVGARWLGEPSSTARASLLRAMFRFANLAAILIAVAAILGMFWTKENWGRYWAWDLKETGAFLIFGCAVVISALRWIKPAQSFAIFIAIGGNMITAWGWFGANAPASWNFSNPFLVVFLASQLIFILAAAVKGVADLKDERVES